MVNDHNPPVPERYLRAKRKAIESLYCGKLYAFQKVPVTDKKTHITEFKNLATVYAEPCRLSSQSSSPTTENEPAQVSKDIRVILRPEVKIPAGSELIIIQHGQAVRYKCSGSSRYYSDHQSIPLKIEKVYA